MLGERQDVGGAKTPPPACRRRGRASADAGSGVEVITASVACVPHEREQVRARAQQSVRGVADAMRVDRGLASISPHPGPFQQRVSVCLHGTQRRLPTKTQHLHLPDVCSVDKARAVCRQGRRLLPRCRNCMSSRSGRQACRWGKWPERSARRVPWWFICDSGTHACARIPQLVCSRPHFSLCAAGVLPQWPRAPAQRRSRVHCRAELLTRIGLRPSR